MSLFEKIDLGLIPWPEAVTAQHEFARKALNGKRFLLVAEHPPVITLGKNTAGYTHLKIDPCAAKRRGIEIHASDRGGDVTLHLPGQIVFYPVFRLSSPRAVRAYIYTLEQTVIETLCKHGIFAKAMAGLPGVWVEGKKIAFIGIRIKNRVTLHGLALNVNNDLDLFDLIVPCGLQDVCVTSMSESRGRKFDLTSLKQEIVSNFCRIVAPPVVY